MKAIITTLLLMLSISIAFGQQYIINESFEGAWPPSGWVSSGFARGTTANTGTYSASSGRVGNYLITPLITVPSTISYYHRK